MTYREARAQFTKNVAKLIQYAEDQGYEMGIKYCYRCEDCPVGILLSSHKLALAVDMDLWRNGKYLRSTKAHHIFGQYWKALHPLARWGGDFKPRIVNGKKKSRKDGNHYSFLYWGRS
jgi:hypothetical protein